MLENSRDGHPLLELRRQKIDESGHAQVTAIQNLHPDGRGWGVSLRACFVMAMTLIKVRGRVPLYLRAPPTLAALVAVASVF